VESGESEYESCEEPSEEEKLEENTNQDTQETQRKEEEPNQNKEMVTEEEKFSKPENWNENCNNIGGFSTTMIETSKMYEGKRKVGIRKLKRVVKDVIEGHFRSARLIHLLKEDLKTSKTKEQLIEKFKEWGEEKNIEKFVDIIAQLEKQSRQDAGNNSFIYYSRRGNKLFV